MIIETLTRFRGRVLEIHIVDREEAVIVSHRDAYDVLRPIVDRSAATDLRVIANGMQYINMAVSDFRRAHDLLR